MELQFNKTVVSCLHTVAREVQTQEQTQEVRLTDGMPDIGKVLACWGQILLRGKEWRSGGAGTNGGVMVWVLYLPEDNSEPRSVETWLPFQTKWEFPETGRDGTLCALPVLRNVDARSLSARKLMVRTVVGVLGHAMVPAEAEVFSPVEIPDDIYILKNTYPVQLPSEAGEKAFNLEEALALPSSAPGIRKLLRYALRPELIDSKVVADKVVMRGVAILELLYMGVDDQLHSWSFELPFSQYAELDREYGADATAKIYVAVTALEVEQGEEENLNLKAGLTGQYVICDRKQVEVVEDAYSPTRSVVPQISQLQLPSVLDSRTETVRIDHTVESDDMRVTDVVFYPDHPQQFREGDKVLAELTGSFQTLFYNAEGQLNSNIYRWQKEWPINAADNVKVDMTVLPTGKAQATMSTGGIGLGADLLLETVAMADQGIPMVTTVEVGQKQEPDPKRPSLILRKAGTDGLWNLAKRCGSTVDAIKKANALSQEPDSEQVLLIPVL